MPIELTFPEGGVLVTGGTGRIGEGAVRRLASGGVPVVFTYRGNREGALALERDLQSRGCTAIAKPMDTDDPKAIDAAISLAVKEFGRLHGVVCGNGLPVAMAKLMDFHSAEVEQFLCGDAMGYYRVIQRAVMAMRESGGGSISVCSTMALHRVLEFDGISPFSKGAVEALVRQVAAEEGENGIRCNAVVIGWIMREVEGEWNYSRELTVDLAAQRELAEVVGKKITSSIRLGRVGSPEDAGNLCAFLASDQASYITGQSIAVDAGATL